MINILELLNKVGININENSFSILLFACGILILSVISLDCFIQNTMKMKWKIYK